MRDDTAILTEIMLQAEIFCSCVEGTLTKGRAPRNVEARLKIAQCRGAIRFLQGIYEDGQLTFDYQPVAGAFRHLVVALMWVSFYGGSKVEYKLFRKLVQIEAGFTSLLLKHVAGGAGRSRSGP